MTTTLDTKGLSCPLPVLRARKALREVPPGGLMRVLATDPAAVLRDIHMATTRLTCIAKG